MIIIKRIDLTSAFKVGMLVSALYTAVMGLCYGLFVAAMLPSFSNLSSDPAFQNYNFNPNAIAGAGLAGCCIAYAIALVISGIVGGISGVLIALFYNLVSGWVGGLQLELEQVELLEEKPKITLPPDRSI